MFSRLTSVVHNSLSRSKNPGDHVEPMDSPNSDHGDGNNEEPVNSPKYSDHGDEHDEEDALMDEDDVDYYDDDYLFADDDNDGEDQDMMKLQAQFDKLPPGVEASFSIPPTSKSKTNTAASMIPLADDSHDWSWVSAKKQKPGEGSKNPELVLKRYKEFKTFDLVDDFPDHYYKKEKNIGQPSKEWAKKVQDDWRILEKDLPETIFARACESRMDLMRAAITGPQETPYHDGLFMFDIYFPPNYPQEPPKVNYHAHGMRLNPNLYAGGKVCLSLLNTWSGQGCEKWQPKTSTMLQVLVSIQALILNDKPYFNEPGYEHRFTGAKGEQKCIEYSENILFMSLKTMMYTINNSPKKFEDLVAAHFCVFARDILATCTAHMDGARIGTVVRGEYPLEKKITKLRTNVGFSVEMAKLINAQLIPWLRKCGANCDDYIVKM